MFSMLFSSVLQPLEITLYNNIKQCAYGVTVTDVCRGVWEGGTFGTEQLAWCECSPKKLTQTGWLRTFTEVLLLLLPLLLMVIIIITAKFNIITMRVNQWKKPNHAATRLQHETMRPQFKIVATLIVFHSKKPVSGTTKDITGTFA